MANIIRCKLPDGIHRFKPFTVEDYRDFLLVRNDILKKEDDEQVNIIKELVDDYFNEYPKSLREYIFLQVFLGSLGKSRIPINFECPKCGKIHKGSFNIRSDKLEKPNIDLGQLKMTFKFIDDFDKNNTALSIIKSIDTIEFNNKIYNWADIESSSKNDIISLLDFTSFEKIDKKLKPIYHVLKLKCCYEHEIVYDNLTDLFKLLINPDEVFSFYEINDLLIKNNYDLQSILKMLPAERSMVLALIERKNKK